MLEPVRYVQTIIICSQFLIDILFNSYLLVTIVWSKKKQNKIYSAVELGKRPNKVFTLVACLAIKVAPVGVLFLDFLL